MAAALPNAAFPSALRRVGKLEVSAPFASGGMASVHVGRLSGPAGFAKLVAVKQILAALAKSDRHVRMLLEEARLTSRIRSPYVVPILDVVHEDGDLAIVMELVRGVSLGALLGAVTERGGRVPPGIAVAIVGDALRGLHAAHEAVDPAGRPLSIIHRDVSPHNFIVGADGVTRVLDFGVAKGAGSEGLTQAGEVKGKLGYMPPEQLVGPVTREADVYAAGVVLWEALRGERLRSDEVKTAINEIMCAPIPRLDAVAAPPPLADVVERALSREPSERYFTAEAMAVALEEACPPATRAEVGQFVERFGFDALDALDAAIRECDASARAPAVTPAVAPAARGAAVATSPVTGGTRMPRRRRAWLAMLAGLIVGALASGAVVFLRRAPPRQAPIAPIARVEPSGSSLQLGPVPLPPPVGPSASAVVLPPSVAAAPSAATVASASAAPPPAPATAAPAKQPKAPAPPRASCNPPFEYDRNGRKHYKRECLP